MKLMNSRKAFCCLAFAILASVRFAGSAQAATRIWDTAGGGNWSVDGNWDAPTAPVDNDSVVFGSTGSDFANTNDIGALSLGTFTVTEGDHTLDLGGNAITTTTFAVQGLTTAKTGTLSVVNGGSITVTDAMNIGYGDDANAHLTLAAGVPLAIGEESSRATLRVLESILNLTVVGQVFDASLTAGNSFNAWLTDLHVGYRPAGFTHGIPYGLLDLSAVTTPGVVNITGDLRIGDGRNADGDVIFSDVLQLIVGSETARAGDLIIRRGSANDNYGSFSSLILGANRFDAYVNNLIVGQGRSAVGVLDASQVTEGVLDIAGDCIIGDCNFANPAQAGGTVLIPNGMDVKIGDPVNGRGQLIVGNATYAGLHSLFNLGTGNFEAHVSYLSVGHYTGLAPSVPSVTNEFYAADVENGVIDLVGPFLVGAGRNSGTLPGHNILTLSENFVTTIGADTDRAPMVVGEGRRCGYNTVTINGSFSAYLESLTVGRNTTTDNALSQGLLDLSGVTNGFLDVTGTIIIGDNVQGDGEVRLPAIPVKAGDLLVGSTSASSKGKLVMTGTVFSVTNSVVLDGPSVANKARVLTTLTGTSGGLDLGPDASLTVNQGVIDITFAEPPSDSTQMYWGLRWEGDRVSELETLETAGKLTWNDNALTLKADIHYNGTYTYIGVPPPFGTLFMFR